MYHNDILLTPSGKLYTHLLFIKTNVFVIIKFLQLTSHSLPINFSLPPTLSHVCRLSYPIIFKPNTYAIIVNIKSLLF